MVDGNPPVPAPPGAGTENGSSKTDLAWAQAGLVRSVFDQPRAAVANETRARLEIQEGDSTLVLAPLERRLLPWDCVEKLDLERLKLLGYVNVNTEELEGFNRRRERAVLIAGSIYGGLAFLLWGIFVGTSWWYWALLGLIVAVAAVRLLGREEVGVRSVQALYLLIVLVVGVGMPVMAVWAGGDIDDTWNSALNGTGNDQEIATLTLLGRGIQTIFIVVVTLLPGLLYFLFDRYRLSTLGEEFTRQIFRLDWNLKTRGDVDAKYGHLLGEAYGHQHRRHGKSGRIQPGTRLPIVIATVVFALGWIVVLLNAEAEITVLPGGDGIRSLITPWQSATAFAFLGSYVFLLQAALRAYLRGDLRPKFYGYAALRVVVAVVFSWVLDLMIPSDGALLLVPAFAVGLVPDTFLLRLREFVRENTLDILIEKHPLTELEGIDVYDRTRLEQEGVTNVEALAHSNLVELMLQTRIPVGRLVDWADQAQLRLHLDAREAEHTLQLQSLRARGIRTASDLLVTHRAALKRSQTDADALLKAFGSVNGLSVLQTMIDAIKDDEWMPQILEWHNPRNRAERTLVYPQDFAKHRDPVRQGGGQRSAAEASRTALTMPS